MFIYFLNEDKNGIKKAAALRQGRSLDKAKSIKQWFGLAFGDALVAAAKYQLHVHRGIMRTVNLVEKPGGFLKDKRIRNTVFRYMLRGRKKNAAARIQRSVDRDEMIKVIGEPT